MLDFRTTDLQFLALWSLGLDLSLVYLKMMFVNQTTQHVIVE